jgi:Ca2+-binding RTX toxin-like protein
VRIYHHSNDGEIITVDDSYIKGKVNAEMIGNDLHIRMPNFYYSHYSYTENDIVFDYDPEADPTIWTSWEGVFASWSGSHIPEIPEEFAGSPPGTIIIRNYVHNDLGFYFDGGLTERPPVTISRMMAFSSSIEDFLANGSAWSQDEAAALGFGAGNAYGDAYDNGDGSAAFFTTLADASFSYDGRDLRVTINGSHKHPIDIRGEFANAMFDRPNGVSLISFSFLDAVLSFADILSLVASDIAAVTGTAGNDLLFGNAGRPDFIHGGAGIDTFVFSAASGSDTIRTDAQTWAETDLIRFGFAHDDVFVREVSPLGAWHEDMTFEFIEHRTDSVGNVHSYVSEQRLTIMDFNTSASRQHFRYEYSDGPGYAYFEPVRRVAEVGVALSATGLSRTSGIGGDYTALTIVSGGKTLTFNDQFWESIPGDETNLRFDFTEYLVFGDRELVTHQWLAENVALVMNEDYPTATGTRYSERIAGSAADDWIEARDGDDRITGGTGDDSIFGEDGADTAFYSGAALDYDISAVDGGFQIIHARNNGAKDDGADLVFGVEKFNFNGVVYQASEILNINHAPVLALPLADMSALEDNAVSFVLPAGSFTDVDSTLALSAKLADGSALPSWLSFNAATRTFSGTPPLNFNGVLQVTVTASDGSLSVSDQIALTITPVNDAPVLALPLADTASLEDTAVSFALPAGSFADVDSALALSATLTDGSALSAWLSFDAATQTFSGTPPLNFNGVLQVVVTASDGSLSASDQFTLTIDPVNDAPVLALPLADVFALEDNAVSFVLPEGSFTDVDGALVLSATLADGSALPSWLSFDATTRTFSGTPPLNFNGVLQVVVTASDGSLSASDQFTLTIDPVNDAPVLALPLADVSALEDEAVSFALPAGSFTDVDSALALSAKLADGSALPSWLSFNAATRTFSGTPPLNFNGVLQVTLTASDGSLSASDQFALTIDPVNDAPVLALPLADQSSLEDHAVSFVLPAGSFTDVDSTLALSAKSVDGSALPTWLTFNAATRTFSGTPPLNFNGVLQVVVTASDGSLSASYQFALTIAPVNDAPILAIPLVDQNGAQGQPLSFTVPANAFTDVDSSLLSFTATQANGTALPSWLSFNAVTHTFSGTPPLSFSGVLQIVVTASDGALSASDQLALTITPAVVDPYAGWMKGTVGNDLLLGSLSAPNQIYGDAGNDVLTGGLYDDKLDGGTGDDVLWGLAGSDVLSGNAGNDFLFGGPGNDRIIGGLGKDVMSGGLDSDLFVFASATDSGTTVATRDQIIDFTKGQDKFDFSQIDAKPLLSGDQAFTLLATAGAAFTGTAGQLRWFREDVAGTANDNTIIVGDINGDKIADFQVEIDGLFNLSSSDFVL